MSSKEELTLYHYWRSSSSWRVRWALEIKEVPCKLHTINLLENEQTHEEYLQKNPMGQVPCLQIGNTYFSESLAIIEWLEENYPHPHLLPADPKERMLVRSLAQIIASDTQPLQNLHAQRYYSKDEKKRKEYAQYWIRRGLNAYESTLKQYSSSTSNYSVGQYLTTADLCLIPQCYNALRFEVNLNEFPLIEKIYQYCINTDTCKASHPDQYAPGHSQRTK